MLGSESANGTFPVERCVQLESKVVRERTRNEILMMVSLFQRKGGRGKDEDLEVACGSSLVNLTLIRSESVLPLTMELFYHGNVSLTKALPKSTKASKLLTSSTKFGELSFKVTKRKYTIQTEGVQKKVSVQKSDLIDYVVEFVISFGIVKIFDNSLCNYSIELNSVFLTSTITMSLENGRITSEGNLLFNDVSKRFFVRRSSLLESSAKSLVVKLIKEESQGNFKLHCFGKTPLVNLEVLADSRFDIRSDFAIDLDNVTCQLKSLDQETLGSLNVRFQLNSITQKKEKSEERVMSKIEETIKNRSEVKKEFVATVELQSVSMISELPCKDLPLAIEQSQCQVARNFNMIKDKQVSSSPFSNTSNFSSDKFPKIPVFKNLENIDEAPVITEQSEFNKSVQSHFESYGEHQSYIHLEDIQEGDISHDLLAFDTFSPKKEDDLHVPIPQRVMNLLNANVRESIDNEQVTEELSGILKSSDFSNSQIESIGDIPSFVFFKKQVFEFVFIELCSIINKIPRSDLEVVRDMLLNNSWIVPELDFRNIIKRLGNSDLIDQTNALVLLGKSSHEDQVNVSNVLSLIDFSLNSKQQKLSEFIFKEIKTSSVFQFHWTLYLKSVILKWTSLGLREDKLRGIALKEKWRETQEVLLSFGFGPLENLIVYYGIESDMINKLFNETCSEGRTPGRGIALEESGVDADFVNTPKQVISLVNSQKSNLKIQNCESRFLSYLYPVQDPVMPLENIRLYMNTNSEGNRKQEPTPHSYKLKVGKLYFSDLPIELHNRCFSLKIKLDGFPRAFESRYFKCNSGTTSVDLDLEMSNCQSVGLVKFSLLAHENNQVSSLVACNSLNLSTCSIVKQSLDLLPIPVFFVKSKIHYTRNCFGTVDLTIEEEWEKGGTSEVYFSRNLQNEGQLVVAIENVILDGNIRNELKGVDFDVPNSEFVILMKLTSSNDNILFTHTLLRRHLSSKGQHQELVESILDCRMAKGVYKVPIEILDRDLQPIDYSKFKVSLSSQYGGKEVEIGECRINIAMSIQNTNEEGVSYYLDIAKDSRILASTVIHGHFTNAPHLYTNSFVETNEVDKNVTSFLLFDILCLAFPSRHREPLSLLVTSMSEDVVYYNGVINKETEIENVKNNFFRIFDSPMRNVIVPIKEKLDEFSIKIQISSADSSKLDMKGTFSTNTVSKSYNNSIHHVISFENIGAVANIRALLVKKDARTPFQLVKAASTIMDLDLLKSSKALMEYLNKYTDIDKIHRSEFQKAIKMKTNCTRSELSYFECVTGLSDSDGEKSSYQKLYPRVAFPLLCHVSEVKLEEFCRELSIFDEELTGHITLIDLERILSLQDDLFTDDTSMQDFVASCPRDNDTLCYIGGLMNLVHCLQRTININKKSQIRIEGNSDIQRLEALPRNDQVAQKIKSTLEGNCEEIVRIFSGKFIYIESIQANGLKRVDGSRKPNSFVEISVIGCYSESVKSSISVCSSSPTFHLNKQMEITDINSLAANFYLKSNCVRTYIREFSSDQRNTIRDVLFSEIYFALSDFFTMSAIGNQHPDGNRLILQQETGNGKYSIQLSLRMEDIGDQYKISERQNQSLCSRDCSPGLKDTLNTLKELQKHRDEGRGKSPNDFDPSILDFLKNNAKGVKSKFFENQSGVHKGLPKETLNVLFDQLSKSIPQTSIRSISPPKVDNSVREYKKYGNIKSSILKDNHEIKEDNDSLKTSQHSNPFLKVIGDSPEEKSEQKSSRIDVLHTRDMMQITGRESPSTEPPNKIKKEQSSHFSKDNILTINDSFKYVQSEPQGQRESVLQRIQRTNWPKGNVLDKLSKSCFSVAEQRRIKKMIETQLVPEEIFDFDSDEDTD